MIEKKKVALLIPAMDDGGVGRVLEILSQGLSSDKYDQYILVLISDRCINYKYNGEIIKITKEGKGVCGKALAFIKRIMYVRNIKKRYQFDVVISFGATANAINAITRQKKEKIIMTQHSVTSIEHSNYGLYGKIANLFVRTYNMADVVIVVSSYIKIDLIQKYNINSEIIKVIYNGINLELIGKKAEDCTDLSFMDGKVNLISVGRLSKGKGLLHIIKIMPELIEIFPNIQLILIGDGEQRECLERITKRLQLQEYVIFLGRKENPFPYLKQADLFVFPSYYEGFGLAFVEAMSLGIPVIAADCISGPREVLADNDDYADILQKYLLASYGVLVPRLHTSSTDEESVTMQEQELERAIVDLLMDKNLQAKYRLKSKERSKDFSCNSMISKYEYVIDNL